MSTNRDRFVRLAEARVPKAIKSIRLVGNLANRSNYRYTEEDIEKIIKVLENEVRGLKEKFKNNSKDNEIHFNL